MIRIKDAETLRSIIAYPMHQTLVDLVLWVAERYVTTITQGYEDRDYSSVHSVIPFRGLDIRSWEFRDPLIVCDEINANWIYDPSRPEYRCAVYHDTGRGKHIHLQVHERTVRA